MIKEIGPAIYQAIDILKKCWGGIEIEIISDGMYRLPPNEYSRAGMLGVDITIKPINSDISAIKTFLGYESMAEEIVYTPYGGMIADHFIWELLGEQLKEEMIKLKEQYAVFEKVPAHGREVNGIILGPFNTKEEALEKGKKYGYYGDNYYVDKIAKHE